MKDVYFKIVYYLLPNNNLNIFVELLFNQQFVRSNYIM